MQPAPTKQKRRWERFDIGFKLGLSLAQLTGKDATSDIAEFSNKPDITFGITGLIELHRWITLQPEVLFISKGRRVNVDGMLINTLDVDYFEFPLLAHITIPVGEQVTPYFLIGPAIGVLYRFQVESENDDSITDRTDQAKTIDLSGIAGAGIKVSITPQHVITLEGRYDRSFTRFLEEEEDIKNRAFAFMLGYQYSLSSTSSSQSPPPSTGDEPALLDSDGDGILDEKDDCPNEAGPLELRGCPGGDQ